MLVIFPSSASVKEIQKITSVFQVTLTASTDNGTAQVVIPSANVTSIVVPQEAYVILHSSNQTTFLTRPCSDIGGTADAAGAVANVVNQVYQYIQGLVNNDIQVRFSS